MSQIKINYSRVSEKFFNKHLDIKEKFIKKIKQAYLLNDKKDIKRLKGFGQNIYRMRINNYRVIYQVHNLQVVIIYVLKAGLRGDIYK